VPQKTHKVALIVGTRPEAIKLAPVYRKLAEPPERFVPLLWATAQHRQMLDQVMDTFGLKADQDFDLMQPGQSLTAVTAAILSALEKAFQKERPDAILVQGDTTTVFAASLSAYYFKIPVGHVEAGLRTRDKFAPYPEEMNRRLATRLADFHFAPTEGARKNLLAENVPEDRIWVTGNTVIDALDIMLAKVRQQTPQVLEGFPLDEFESGRPVVLITGHRREHFGPGFESICRAVAELSVRHPEWLFVYPVHLNPNVQEPVYRLLKGYPNVRLMPPLEYSAFIWAMDRCTFLLSDSGGIQEEASHLGKPVLVMRQATERPEGVEAGILKLVGDEKETIVREASRLIEEPTELERMSHSEKVFGDGRASERIVEVLSKSL